MYAYTEEHTEQLQGLYCSRSRQDIDVRTHGGRYRTVAGFVFLQTKTGYRCKHTPRNIQNSCRDCILLQIKTGFYILSWSGAIQTLQLFCMFLRVCVHLYPVLIWSNTNPATVLYVPPCVRTYISCLDLEQCKPCNSSVCSSVCAYIYILSWSGAHEGDLFLRFICGLCIHLDMMISSRISISDDVRVVSQ
jgi:hypothetical protein